MLIIFGLDDTRQNRVDNHDRITKNKYKVNSSRALVL